jgi:beta-barrel assembly-enhancing protease
MITFGRPEPDMRRAFPIPPWIQQYGWPFIGWGILLILMAACASTHLTPIGAGGQAFRLQDDERRLWARAQEEQERLDKSGLLYVDPDLESYVNEIARRLLPPGVPSQDLSIKVRILQNPLLNAFAMPNGTIYLHTGLLARMENEAQLAALLGHEITHATHRHSAKHFRDVQNKAAALSVLRMTTAGVGNVFGGLGGLAGDFVNLLGTVGAVASIYGYSRDLEREADLEGFRRLINVGYDPTEASKLFGHLQRKLDEEKDTKEPFFFGTHPRLQERIDTYTELLRTQYPREAAARGRLRNAEPFLARTQRLLLDNAVLDLRIGRFNTAKVTIEKFLQQAPSNPRALYLLGEVLRQQATSEHTAQAVQAYKSAMTSDPEFADPYKGLGLLYYKHNQREWALPLFERYLTLAPEASERGYIDAYVRELKAGGSR